MATKKKMLQAAAGNAGGGGPLNVEDVFSTYLYSGTSVNPNVISNNIDLAGEGGMVWLKTRTAGFSHTIFDTERGVNKYLSSDTTGAEGTGTSITSFNSDGFTLGTTSILYNSSSYDYASWTFRKAPKFFDVVTWSGDNVVGREIPHSLGSTPGCIIMKATSVAQEWVVYHRSNTANPETEYLVLNTTAATADYDGWWDDTAPTSTNFTLGIDNNQTGRTYVAYLFAHNDGDGEFGPDGDADIIKCGSYTTDSNEDATIDLGFEPQWVLAKRTDSSTGGTWMLFDNMRGLPGDFISQSALLEANDTNAESNVNRMIVTPTGFKVDNYGANRDYIYIAIRRGTKVPESGTEVFAIDTRAGGTPSFISSFPVDMGWKRTVNAGSQTYVASRMTGTNFLATASTGAESTDSGFVFDYMNGWADDGLANSNVYSWMWKRAPGYFDVVAFSGNSTAGRTVSHNLGVEPNMMIVKRRTTAGASWTIYVSDLGATKYLRFNTNAAATSIGFWNNTAPTSSVFTVGSDADVNGSGEDYIAYLFATLPGISKVGSYTGTGATLNIDCGFTSGARFVLIKRTNDTNEWTLFDTARGIVAGNDPYLYLSNTSAEVNAADFINPYSAGFSLTGVSSLTNENGDSYIFYAIA